MMSHSSRSDRQRDAADEGDEAPVDVVAVLVAGLGGRRGLGRRRGRLLGVVGLLGRRALGRRGSVVGARWSARVVVVLHGARAGAASSRSPDPQAPQCERRRDGGDEDERGPTTSVLRGHGGRVPIARPRRRSVDTVRADRGPSQASRTIGRSAVVDRPQAQALRRRQRGGPGPVAARRGCPAARRRACGPGRRRRACRRRCGSSGGRRRWPRSRSAARRRPGRSSPPGAPGGPATTSLPSRCLGRRQNAEKSCSPTSGSQPRRSRSRSSGSSTCHAVPAEERVGHRPVHAPCSGRCGRWPSGGRRSRRAPAPPPGPRSAGPHRRLTDALQRHRVEPLGRGVEADHLAPGVHAGVGAAGAGQLDRRPQHLLERVAQGAADGGDARRWGRSRGTPSRRRRRSSERAPAARWGPLVSRRSSNSVTPERRP